MCQHLYNELNRLWEEIKIKLFERIDSSSKMGS